ncbi:LL-diaminopimelate aminotransferase [Pullulanibacillus sp. KACC 23026]|uniref:LL-diaminopimelate aminotransferase n=1 Tax=Pullulanibacillus sp. KACC 23026 TaxID=3028315 RepID=UPI0023B1A3F7|nr:LL-diaminopimelate aminotransferase [Pullulanibacillus sp. KACC 23026]WEG11793.1 LL-diaminopimelate aminotransferase [Pullulanibacillus sp. KACC 23026]
MSNWPLSRTASSFKTLIFSELADYKGKKSQEGASLIDLSIGSPDQGPPPFLMETLSKASLDPAQYGYTLSGSQEFNEAVAAYYKKFNVELDPKSEILQVMGSQDGLVHLPMIYAEEGDIILVPDPGYTAYEAGVKLSGADLYPLPLQEQNGFLPDLSTIPEEVAQKAKLMILNFPGNPVPALATKAFFKEAVSFAKNYELIVVHDFAYCELIFDGHKPISFMSVEGAKEVGVEFNSLSKSFNLAGTRIGYAVGNSEIIQELERLKSNLDYGIFSPIQRTAIQALLHGETFTKANRLLYEKRRDVLITGLNEAGWNVTSPPAAMFVWAKLPAGYTSESFTYELIDRTGVVVTPGNAFGKQGEGYVRMALVQPEALLKEAAERIKDMLQS